MFIKHHENKDALIYDGIKITYTSLVENILAYSELFENKEYKKQLSFLKTARHGSMLFMPHGRTIA